MPPGPRGTRHAKSGCRPPLLPPVFLQSPLPPAAAPPAPGPRGTAHGPRRTPSWPDAATGAPVALAGRRRPPPAPQRCATA
ncbi:hypothetical protein GUJ93_ZPchr0002g24370 [Zizania palustris]|uniref:Uncharacterized protein n=1 Tax=Zizania palustris TaxID=103762 RepID=A0A8J5S6N7_ZIZPA|nr:hypothetical protein GUJ93_ZPchr0002g24370 [Zizania palustris]